MFNAGLDPVLTMEKYRDRVSFIHLKDGIPSDDDKKCFEHVNEGVQGLSLGSGKAPVKAVRDWALKNGVVMVVESEGLQPTGLEEVKRCIDYLESIE